MKKSRDELVKEAARLYESGMSTRDLAPLIGVSKSTAALYVKEAGIKTNAAERISAKMIGEPGRRKGKKHTEKSLKKMSEAHSGHRRNVGSKRTQEQRETMRQKALARWNEHNKQKKIARAEEVAKRKQERLLPEQERQARQKARDACKRMLRRVLTMARVRKTLPTEELLGYTKDQLREHIEKQFKEGMSWADRDSFHIDHIIPVAEFFRNGIYDPAKINALSNLQVLTPEENRAKSDKLINRIITITAQGVTAGVKA